MDLEFTPALQFALNRAARIALADGRSDIEPLDLMRGLLVEEEGHAARRLGDGGLTLVSWRARYPADAVVGSEPPSQALPPAPALRVVMARARQEASELTEEGSLSTDQVVSALVAVAGTVREMLEACGLDSAHFRDATAISLEPIRLEEPLNLDEPLDLSGAARIVDAAANRAREALRVLEDHCRFVLDDSMLSRQCKEVRHALAEALRELPAGQLLAARDTVHDVGTTISTPAERERGSLQAVVEANAKRLQEALRSLEEFGKVLSPEFGARIERLRYRSYQIEKALVLGGASRERLAEARLYALVAEESCRASLVGTVRELAEGGVDVIQLREKDLDDRTLLARARELRELTTRLGVLFIVNDRPDIALLAEADGVHLGQDDLPVREARKILGARALIGVSTHDLDQARRAILDGANYLGVGPTFPSVTKKFANFPGLAFVQEVAAETSLPAFVLGGVSLDNLDDVLAAGGRRVALGHALVAADDPRRSAALFRKKLVDATKKDQELPHDGEIRMRHFT